MSTRNAVLSEESLSCPVCLEIFKNPVTIACGHNFCMDCIRSCWDEDTDSDTCKCPECRQDFRPRPPLAKNIVLCKIVERMVKPGVEGSPDTVAAPGEVPCDFCTDNKLRAIKSCVVCMASFCETHLRSHYEDTVFRHHQLEDQVRDFGKRRCPEHGRALEFYCRTNQSCLCSVCAIKGHRDHDTVTVEEEVAEIKNHIEERQVELERDRQITTGEMGKLRHSVELFDEFHRRLKTEILQNFVELIENVEQAQREVIEMINTEQRNGITQANRFMNQMENKCSEVNQEKHQLDAVSKICDSFHLIQEYHRIKIVPVQQVLSHTQLTVDVKLTDLSRTVAEISNLVKNQLVKSTSENGPIADDEMEASWPLLELPTQCVSGPSEQAACQTFLPYSETPCQCTLTAGQHKDYTSTLHKASQQLPHCTCRMFNPCQPWSIPPQDCYINVSMERLPGRGTPKPFITLTFQGKNPSNCSQWQGVYTAHRPRRPLCHHWPEGCGYWASVQLCCF
ncbi:E3 ubiquitin/ISG15 ligase TRIM25-like [Scyliorhinus torazame]|uniref:E3 ubiquitin/ISG15 ligase TRIM25-like n=1 Tax=Scyliorhinus torazame TaxID=75743 RepID=UPI003B5A684C